MEDINDVTGQIKKNKSEDIQQQKEHCGNSNLSLIPRKSILFI